jgi:hypothetical protein
VGDGARALGELGDDLVNRPRVLPGKAHNWFRRWFAKIWKLRGGGLYACGYAVTFIVLEIRSLTGDVFESEGVVDFFTSQVFEFVFRFLSESLLNMIQAFIWPLYVIEFQPPWGVIGLGIAFFVFDRFLRKRVEGWLSGENEEQPTKPDKTA